MAGRRSPDAWLASLVRDSKLPDGRMVVLYPLVIGVVGILVVVGLFTHRAPAAGSASSTTAPLMHAVSAPTAHPTTTTAAPPTTTTPAAPPTTVPPGSSTAGNGNTASSSATAPSTSSSAASGGSTGTTTIATTTGGTYAVPSAALDLIRSDAATALNAEPSSISVAAHSANTVTAQALAATAGGQVESAVVTVVDRNGTWSTTTGGKAAA